MSVQKLPCTVSVLYKMNYLNKEIHKDLMETLRPYFGSGNNGRKFEWLSDEMVIK